MNITTNKETGRCTIECSKSELEVVEQAMWTLRMAAQFLNAEKPIVDKISDLTMTVQCAVSDLGRD